MSAWLTGNTAGESGDDTGGPETSTVCPVTASESSITQRKA
jgi:hypothetical protein